MQRSRNHSVFGRNTRVLSDAVESSLGPCKLDHGGLEPNAVAIYEEVMYRILPLIHSSHESLLPRSVFDPAWLNLSLAQKIAQSLCAETGCPK